jgi:hypothetical protein
MTAFSAQPTAQLRTQDPTYPPRIARSTPASQGVIITTETSPVATSVGRS